VRPPPLNDSYFVRLDSTTPIPTTDHGRTAVARQGFEGSTGPRRRRRRRSSPRTIFMMVLLAALVGWAAWASQQPGGVSGTINDWISNVRGDVAKASVDPDLGKAVKILNAQYATGSTYVNFTPDQLQGLGVGAGIDVVWCSNSAEVVAGGAGGGFQSDLLVNGRDVASVQTQNAQSCPADLANPVPWKTK
jgi:hypothetical protein